LVVSYLIFIVGVEKTSDKVHNLSLVFVID
jgi:hypothetical protein